MQCNVTKLFRGPQDLGVKVFSKACMHWQESLRAVANLVNTQDNVARQWSGTGAKSGRTLQQKSATPLLAVDFPHFPS